MRALIISTDRFPKGNAGATRQEVFAKLFNLNGYDVDVIGLGDNTKFQWRCLTDRIRFISVREEGKSILKRVVGRLLFTHRVKKICEAEKKYDVILIESVPYGTIQYVKKYRKRNGAMIIHDSVEWYSASEFKLGVLSAEYVIKNLNNKYWINKDFKVIAISNYLEKYFISKGCKTIRIPFIYDVQDNGDQTKEISSKVYIMYAGMVGHKDHMNCFLEAVSKISKEHTGELEVHLYGFDAAYLSKVQGIPISFIDELKDVVIFHGRVSRDVVEENLKMATFTILFRDPKERYAKAGFPTKVVESLCHSTPVLCNYSSDLKYYLKDGKNAVISKDESSEQIYRALTKIMSLSSEEIKIMQQEAFESANKYFDYQNYKDIFGRFITEE